MIPVRTIRFDDIRETGTVPIAVVHLQRHANTSMHTHDFSELVIVLQGSAVHFTPETEDRISTGDVLVLHGEMQHGYRDTASLEIVNVLFRMDQLGLNLRDAGTLAGFDALFGSNVESRFGAPSHARFRLLAEHLTKVKNRLNEMLIEQRTRPAGWQFALNAHFMLIVSDLSRAYSEQDNPVMRSLTRLGDVISYVHRNYAQNMTLDDLAKVANMSTRTLTREFKNALGISPIDYLIRERVNRAMDLLRYSDITITEAAYRVGFADGSYFTRKFHALVGHSPREARRLKMT